MQKTLNPRAQAELEDLRDAGIEVTWQDVVTINHLSELVESPQNNMSSARGEPVRVAGAILWPFTLQGCGWWDDHKDWFEGVNEQTIALAYIMAHGRRASLRARLATQPVARRAISAWAKLLTCTMDELLIAVGTVLESMDTVADEVPTQDDEDANDAKGMSDGEMVAYLVANTGIEPDYWERKVSMPYIAEQVRRIIKQGDADDKPSRHDPRIIAERNLGYAIIQIESRG